MELIRLSTVGRKVDVGNLYNYFTDSIIQSYIPVLDRNVLINLISAPKVERSYFFQQPNEFKCHILGINSHLKKSIDSCFLSFHELWFAGYLQTKSSEKDAAQCTTAQVDVIFRIVKRIESLRTQHLENSFKDFQLHTGGVATHLIEEVVYGIEMICSVQRVVDLNCESQSMAEEEIYLAVKTFLEKTMDVNSSKMQMPVELENVHCTTFTSLEPGLVTKSTFHEFCVWARELIDCDSEVRPIEIVLRCIPAQFEARLEWEKFNDIKLFKERNAVLVKWIKSESIMISKHPSIDCIPPLENLICQFIDLLPLIWKIIEMRSTTEQVLNDLKLISDLLTDMKEWLIDRRQEIQIVCSLLSDNNLMMLDLKETENRQKIVRVFIMKMDYVPDLLMERMKNFIGRQETSERPIFGIFTAEKRLLERLCEMLKTFAATGKIVRGIDHLIALVPFSSPFECGITLDILPNVLPNSPLNTSSIQHDRLPSIQLNSMLFPPVKAPLGPNLYNHRQQLAKGIKPVVCLPGSYRPTFFESSLNGKKEEHGRLGFLSSSAEPSSNHQINSLIPPSSCRLSSSRNWTEEQTIVHDVMNTVESSSNTTLLTLKEPLPIELAKKNSFQESCTDNGRDKVEESCSCKKFQRNRSRVSSAALIEEFTTNSNDQVSEGENDQFIEIIEKIILNKVVDLLEPKVALSYGTQSNQQLTVVTAIQEHRHDVEAIMHSPLPSSNRKIAEIFARDSNLIKEGQPNIYQLDAKEILANEDFGWFEVVRPDGVAPSPGLRNHKIIILMGATGCGKSTLINGMVNYILGVQWNDPFRFKCVREDGNVKNQAHSQTSSVTAYTLRHQDGMSIPHSITIIDTPGYGDTRGIQRDKEITANIHRFLTQQETQIDEIHAACFVAASGDSRLTATQRYIIDSVLSIFGKDMKENLRLLVTFADNALPPVIEACEAAHFPTTSASGITYSKFNSSVLYSTNGNQVEGDFNIDKLFWDMGQENFQKFFDMLVQMDGCNLTATREVIQRRHQLEQSLQDIEWELEICLVSIEEVEKFRQQLRVYDHNMEANKNFIVENTEMRLVEVTCDNGFMAFNCQICQKTCEKPSLCKKFQKRSCCDATCQCPKSAHRTQPFTLRKTLATVKTTFNDMKAKFESNSNRKLSTEDLMAKCSADLSKAKAKVLCLLDQLGANASSLDSTALRSNALNPAEYLSLMRSCVLEEQAPGYLTRLQTLTELQQSLAASARKDQSSTSRATPEPVRNANTSSGRGRGILSYASVAGISSESKPTFPGRNARDEMPSRSRQIPHSDVPSSPCTVAGSVNRNHVQNETSGIDANGTLPMTSGQANGRCGVRGRSRSNTRDTAANVIHGAGYPWKHPPGEPNDYYCVRAEILEKPCSTKKEDGRNPDGAADSVPDAPYLAHGETIVSNKSNAKLADGKDNYSSDDESDKRDGNNENEKKSDGLWAKLKSQFRF